jgi:hypothetical protein
VPRLLLLVQRRYPLLYWCRSRKQFVTPKALAAAQQRAERQQEQVGEGRSARCWACLCCGQRTTIDM